jgi:ElaA protein
VPTVLDAATGELDPVTLYEILRLRTDVFVVEQECPYPELDGRDLEPDARQVWIADGEHIQATLRVLRDPDGTARIGRVATAKDARGKGLAAVLMHRAIELAGEHDVVLDAQKYLEGWYARFGFEPDGPDYIEDGIPHVPMRRHLQSGR